MRACSNTDVSAMVVRADLHVATWPSSCVWRRWRYVRTLTQDVHTNLAFESSEEVTVAPTFDALGLRDDLLRGIYAYSTSHPLTQTSRSPRRSSSAPFCPSSAGAT